MKDDKFYYDHLICVIPKDHNHLNISKIIISIIYLIFVNPHVFCRFTPNTPPKMSGLKNKKNDHK